MLIKVCGLRESEDLISVAQLGADYAGFIFAASSPRYAGSKLDAELTTLLSRSAPSLKKTGVFVDADEEEILQSIELFHLNAVQLHGNEPPEFCEKFSRHAEVIKTFSIANADDFFSAQDYQEVCSYFLFDTKGIFAGGNGSQFDWDLLNAYDGATPFFLSGGIGQQDTLRILEIDHPSFAGIDVNSRFENYPGKKDISRLSSFIHAFKTRKNELPGF